jgi:hypothetical protein
MTDNRYAGRIHCRLSEGSVEVRELGKLILHQAYRYRNPFFSVEERGSHDKPETRDLSPVIVSKMIREGKFQMRRLNIQLKNRLSEVNILLYLNEEHKYTISGFPRCMYDDGTGDISTQGFLV